MPSFNLFHQGSPNPDNHKGQLIRSLLRDLGSQLPPERIESNSDLAKALADATVNGGLVKDRKYVAEKAIAALASLPPESEVREVGTGLLLKSLWDSLEHPPISYMGDAFRYRTADGSNNNVMFPHVGKSGSFYARSVTPKHVPPAALPDPGTLFDALLARQGPPKQHPSKISSVLFALATIIIHDVFRTSDLDQNIVNVSSYLDLSPLYGPTQDIQDTIRTFKDGKVKPDTFAETRLLGQPPESGALLVCFSRFHNYVAEQLAIINEAGKFSLPNNLSQVNTEAFDNALSKRDNDLFQTARLVTCGLYINIITCDYLRTILNLHRTDSTWTLNPRKDYGEMLGLGDVEKGIGNQVSVEFNLIYRWHSTISARNEQWVKSFFKRLLPGTKPEDMSQPEFRSSMRAWASRLPTDPGQRTFAGLKRNSTGYYNDTDLVRILSEATEDIAGCFGARNVPVALKAVEILGIQQSRAWGIASLNELRKYFGMLPHKTFSDINSDPVDIAATLEALYGDVENVEMYPGVVVEEAKMPMIPGSGLCAGFTTTRAILSDAAALVRGDRFYTVDYSPSNLTAFGFKEVSSDTTIAGGGVIYRLLMRAFPYHYRGNSIYAFYPFTVPAENRLIQQSLGRESDFDYTPPQPTRRPTLITTWKGVNSVLLNPQTFKAPWGKHMRQLSNYDYMLGGDNLGTSAQRKSVGQAIYGTENALKDFHQFFTNTTSNLIRRRSHKIRNIYEIDVVQDIANLSYSSFVARLFDIPLKSEHGNTTLDTRKLSDLLRSIFAYIFLDYDVVHSAALKNAALKASRELTDILNPICETHKAQSFYGLLPQLHLKAKVKKPLPNHGNKLLQRLFEGGKGVNEVVSIIMSTACAAAVPGPWALSQILDLFLKDSYSAHWTDIQKLANDNSPQAFEKLRKYALEALRITTPGAHLLRTAEADATIVDGHQTHQVKKGETISISLQSASVDCEKFPAPEEIRLDRPEDAYIHFGYGPHVCLGRHIITIALVAQFRVFAQLKNFRRAPGLRGRLVQRDIAGFQSFLSERGDAWEPLPASKYFLRFSVFELLVDIPCSYESPLRRF
ncbi:heme peroxidase [Lindgomyces ingoldianus]|uniref:Heme peroxidase n=1 Tax=Lindgomyces ingoldianus TaxID=673940 RepID=A0ACB6QEV7_9PLEO|nr:heme peroxidase [Lindgomyces ingoldianus]KAF2465444.1 heme peroxidase [Lindgomyces ingoldianus]